MRDLAVGLLGIGELVVDPGWLLWGSVAQCGGLAVLAQSYEEEGQPHFGKRKEEVPGPR